MRGQRSEVLLKHLDKFYVNIFAPLNYNRSHFLHCNK